MDRDSQLVTERYFKDRDDSDYYIPISNTAKEIITNKPKYWEDKLFREVFRRQRQYLDSFIPVDSYNRMAQYLFGVSSSERLDTHIENMLEKLKSINIFASQINKEIQNINEARGVGVPGNADKIVQCARDCFNSYIYHIEMLYDISFIYMPEGDSVKKWIKESIMTLIMQYDNYILDEFDIVANELAESGKSDRKMFEKHIDINLSLDSVAIKWAIIMILYEKLDRRVVYYIPIKRNNEIDILEGEKKILVSPDVYEEYIKLKNNYATNNLWSELKNI